jgi:hypothetical protein
MFNFESFDAKCELVIRKLQQWIEQLNLLTQMLLASYSTNCAHSFISPINPQPFWELSVSWSSGL